MTLEQATTRALLSMLDVVQEIANEVSKDPRWVKTVADTFDDHRDEIKGAVGEWLADYIKRVPVTCVCGHPPTEHDHAPLDAPLAFGPCAADGCECEEFRGVPS